MSRPEVIIPVKNLGRAKKRLSGLLDGQERAELVLAMLGDLVAAVHQAGLSPHVLSPDPDVLTRAAQLGARALREHPSANSLNAALERAVADTFHDAAAVLVVLGDTPLTTAEELREIVEPADGDPGDAPLATIISDRSAQGTNALLLRPPTAVPMGFGTDSTARHLEAARARGVACRVQGYDGLGLDLDTPADVQLLLDRPGSTETQRLLARLRVGERLSHVRQ